MGGSSYIMGSNYMRLHYLILFRFYSTGVPHFLHGQVVFMAPLFGCRNVLGTFFFLQAVTLVQVQEE